MSVPWTKSKSNSLILADRDYDKNWALLLNQELRSESKKKYIMFADVTEQQLDAEIKP